MDIQTQDALPASAVSQALLAEQGAFDQFKSDLTAIRLKRVDAVQQISGLSSTLDGLVQSRDNFIAMFKSEALQMYPDLAGMDMDVVMPQLALGHPLLQLWDQYSGKLNDLNNQILSNLQVMNDAQVGNTALAQQEAQELASYANFQASAVNPFPSPDDLLATLQQIEVIPYVDESSTIVSMDQIERINPEAAAIVANELADKVTSDDSQASDEDEQTKAQVQPLMAADSAPIVQGLTADQADQASVAVSADVLVQPNFKRLGYGLAAVTLAYMIFGKGK